MAKKQNPDAKDNVLVSAAKAIGSAAGKLASLGGIKKTASDRPAGRTAGKLVKKNKSRLPRRQKKAQAKATAAVRLLPPPNKDCAE